MEKNADMMFRLHDNLCLFSGWSGFGVLALSAVCTLLKSYMLMWNDMSSSIACDAT